MPFALQGRHTNAASLEAAVSAAVAAIGAAAKPLWLGGPRLRARGRRAAFLAAAGAEPGDGAGRAGTVAPPPPALVPHASQPPRVRRRAL